jgi:hypothetical protein
MNICSDTHAITFDKGNLVGGKIRPEMAGRTYDLGRD